MLDQKKYQDLMEALIKAFETEDKAGLDEKKPKSKAVSIVSITNVKPEQKGFKIPKAKGGRND